MGGDYRVLVNDGQGNFGTCSVPRDAGRLQRRARRPRRRDDFELLIASPDHRPAVVVTNVSR